MHRSLRSSLLIALMALLLVRGWVGDAMAIGMSSMSAHGTAMAQAHKGMHAAPPAEMQAASTDAPPCHETPAAVHSPADAALVADNDHGAASTDGCGSCTACQLCHSSIAAFTSVVASAHGSPQATPPQPALRFASADLPQGAEPPKS